MDSVDEEGKGLGRTEESVATVSRLDGINFDGRIGLWYGLDSSQPTYFASSIFGLL